MMSFGVAGETAVQITLTVVPSRLSAGVGGADAAALAN